jgi:hypothetical protein
MPLEFRENVSPGRGHRRSISAVAEELVASVKGISARNERRRYVWSSILVVAW